MGVFDAQLSAQISRRVKDEIREIMGSDLQYGMCSEADVIRLLIDRGMPVVVNMTPATRLRRYAEMRRGE